MQIVFFIIALLLAMPQNLMSQVIGPIRSAEERFVSLIDEPSIIKRSLTISPDGTRIAWVEKFEGKEFVVIDGLTQRKYDEIKVDREWSSFSVDGSKISYYGRSGKDWFLVVDSLEKRLVEMKPGQSNSPFLSTENRNQAKEIRLETLIGQKGIALMVEG